MRQSTSFISLAILLASGLLSTTVFAAPYPQADTLTDPIRETEQTVFPSPVKAKRSPIAQETREEWAYDSLNVENCGDVACGATAKRAPIAQETREEWSYVSNNVENCGDGPCATEAKRAPAPQTEEEINYEAIKVPNCGDC